jgi:hypothetical protein
VTILDAEAAGGEPEGVADGGDVALDASAAAGVIASSEAVKSDKVTTSAPQMAPASTECRRTARPGFTREPTCLADLLGEGVGLSVPPSMNIG